VPVIVPAVVFPPVEILSVIRLPCEKLNELLVDSDQAPVSTPVTPVPPVVIARVVKVPVTARLPNVMLASLFELTRAVQFAVELALVLTFRVEVDESNHV
jgi:hypothetical protein